MTNQQHPITPPPELAKQWLLEGPHPWHEYVATQAAQWGADQELEACCEWIGSEGLAGYTSRELRAARRPKPLSLKAQALSLVPESGGIAMKRTYSPDELALIRRALEQLDG